MPTIGLQVHFFEDAVRFEAEPVQEVPVEEESAGGGPTSTRHLIRAVLEAGHLTEAEIADEIGRKVDSVGRTLRRYASTASSPDNRWFNRLPSGRWENLPMGLAWSERPPAYRATAQSSGCAPSASPSRPRTYRRRRQT